MKVEASLKVGAVLSVRVGLVKHVGIFAGYAPDGTPMVISNSLRSGCVAEESLAVFAGGRQVLIEPLASQLPVWSVLQRARQRLGERWNLISFNCEHFVHWALGMEPQSPQLQALVMACGVVGLTALVAR